MKKHLNDLSRIIDNKSGKEPVLPAYFFGILGLILTVYIAESLYLALHYSSILIALFAAFSLFQVFKRNSHPVSTIRFSLLFSGSLSFLIVIFYYQDSFSSSVNCLSVSIMFIAFILIIDAFRKIRPLIFASAALILLISFGLISGFLTNPYFLCISSLSITTVYLKEISNYSK